MLQLQGSFTNMYHDDAGNCGEGGDDDDDVYNVSAEQVSVSQARVLIRLRLILSCPTVSWALFTK